MSIKTAINEALKQAMKDKDTIRLESLRLAKGALLLKEKAGAKDQELSDEEATAVLRAEVRKRQDSIETYQQLGKEDEVAKLRQEVAVLEAFLPSQLGADQIEAKVRAYLAEHPEINHAGKLTGALKKELGDQADGKVLNEVCRKILGG
jgi:hypothetical protein